MSRSLHGLRVAIALTGGSEPVELNGPNKRWNKPEATVDTDR
jgi:hypothetical protein